MRSQIGIALPKLRYFGVFWPLLVWKHLRLWKQFLCDGPVSKLGVSAVFWFFNTKSVESSITFLNLVLAAALSLAVALADLRKKSEDFTKNLDQSSMNCIAACGIIFRRLFMGSRDKKLKNWKKSLNRAHCTWVQKKSCPIWIRSLYF